jgi:hypothetical protein
LEGGDAVRIVSVGWEQPRRLPRGSIGRTSQNRLSPHYINIATHHTTDDIIETKKIMGNNNYMPKEKERRIEMETKAGRVSDGAHNLYALWRCSTTILASKRLPRSTFKKGCSIDDVVA